MTLGSDPSLFLPTGLDPCRGNFPPWLKRPITSAAEEENDRHRVFLKKAGDRLTVAVRTQETNTMNACAEQSVSQEPGTPPSTNGDNREMAQGAAPSNGENGRDSHGRFAKGNSGGPGNPFARKAAALRAAFFNKITEQDIEELAQQLLDRAKSGDLAAMKVLFNYTIGRPTAPVNPDTLDVQEWQLHKESTTDSVEVANALRGVPLPVACEIASSALPAKAKEMADSVSQAIFAEAAAEERERQQRERRNEKRRQPAPDGVVPRNANVTDVSELRCLTPTA